jgi:hypothetical protein
VTLVEPAIEQTRQEALDLEADTMDEAHQPPDTATLAQ